MALTATVADVSRSIRAVDSPDVLAELEPTCWPTRALR